MRKKLLIVLLPTVAVILVDCGGASPRFTSKSVYRVAASTGFVQHRGIASYYAEEFNGKRTSSGELYDMNELTAAHRELPFNTRVKVLNLETGNTVVVRINDRGPFKDDRIIDLSFEAAKQLGILQNGTGPVELEILELGPIQE